MKAGREPDEVYDGAHVGGVEPSAGELGGAGLADEVGAGAIGESGGDGLAVAVIEKGLGTGLGEAGELGVDGQLVAGGVGLEGESAGEKVGVLLELIGIGWRDAADGGQVLFNARLLKAGLSEVLRSADEDARTALYGGLEGGEVAAGFGGHEEHCLLGFGGNGDERTFFADFLVPGFYAEEPVIRWGIGGAAEKDTDEEIVNRLACWKVGVQPDAIAGLEVWD